MKELEAQAPAQATAPATAVAPAAKGTQAPASPAPAAPKPKAVKTAQPFPPIAGPPPTVSGDKQQRLAELLRKYRADEITPEEYHQQRAKIMSE